MSGNNEKVKETPKNNEQKPTKQEFQLLRVEALQEALNVLKEGMDKACHQGVYTTDEAFHLKLAHDALTQCVGNFGPYQKMVYDSYKQAEELEKNKNDDEFKTPSNLDKIDL